jgi:hypothetical protein
LAGRVGLLWDSRCIAAAPWQPVTCVNWSGVFPFCFFGAAGYHPSHCLSVFRHAGSCNAPFPLGSFWVTLLLGASSSFGAYQYSTWVRLTSG